MDALTLLLNRRSTAALEAPGPEGDALDAILGAAVRVPDFQGLRPYEFLIAEGEGRARLGLMMQQAAAASAVPRRMWRARPTCRCARRWSSCWWPRRATAAP
ncbi:nitroreductase family protein [Xanthobacter sediminis]|uniref:hypothetical protein n=1 Tax=Xanthobacter sediminis TaxID=3119926 RepID=UPI00372AC85E